MGRVFRRACALPALALGALGGVLGVASLWPSHPAGQAARRLLRDALLELARRFPELPSGYVMLRTVTEDPRVFALAPLGLLLLCWALAPSRNRLPEEPSADPDSANPRSLRRLRGRAKALARRGDPLGAASLCISHGLLDEAVQHFLDAGAVERAAEVRHDQNCFLEAAELYAQAGCTDAAAALFERHGAHARAAQVYSEADNPSQAASMYEQAGELRLAAEHYEKAEFHRQAAQAYARCEEWERAAVQLERLLAEEVRGSRREGGARGAYEKLVHSCGQLFVRAGLQERAESVLADGGLFSEAAQLALAHGALERAAELFLRARDPERAADILESLGREREACRLRAEQLRDHGDPAAAAVEFERADEWLEAAELHRAVGRDERAAECYERSGFCAQAAEIFAAVGDQKRAAENFARAERYAEAAECFAGLGDAQREVEMLELGGEFLRAGEMHRAAGREPQAVAALQHVPPGHSDFVTAAARLGEIFCARGEAPLAIAKLREVLAAREIDAETVRAFCSLAAAHEVNGERRRAGLLYEKILAFDYLLEEASQGRERCRHEHSAPEAVPAAGRAAEESPRYVVEATLGRGGMGIVYRARDTRLDRVVALKVLPESLGANPRALRNLLREAKSAAQLNHPHIVTVYDAGQEQGRAYIAMEYVDGSTLREIIRKRGPIASRGILEVLGHIAQGLAYAHERKLVHLDVKTANIMWTRERSAKLMDFGLAKWQEEARNQSTVVSGTPYYMSPEQTRGECVDHRSDLYSLGVVAFEMATGGPPFTSGDIAYHHVHTAPPDPAERRQDLPAELCEIISRCLRKDPAARFQSAVEVLEALRAMG